ncbi:tRNA preQ1(34) S-adenosylmethionine ribosyltransferase-isomerase QueA [Candidatus Albibeggiatoa sp. nov. NOAA]|uniref:tRNA preQ1(34) S-adenosylmethionine ribosyltransferase-isomerase QueA n=1 Tax=Candidatus Albibeggiatoa sp. nov. NOAA TaxID=3162724 RepID=UPI003300A8BD|nr:tRNA preQ1(34) S-adenosylmethionine ribosyltransferase-isomerase QueA [Thiotrichaceae bacterium]
MHRSDFHFDLPESLIAQFPSKSRTASRLLHIEAQTHQAQDLQFTDFPSLLKPNDLLIFNDTRVMPARLFAHKATGGKVEILIERLLDEKRVLAQVRASKSPKPETELILQDGTTLTVIQRVEQFFELQFNTEQDIQQILQAVGHMPLPPYIKRDDAEDDLNRYQTVYAKNLGAVAAPTAGLHFDDDILQQIEQKGIQTAFVTLHVGAGTFSPVRVDDITQHKMHSEWLTVSESVCQQIQETRQKGGRVIAIGTTSVRALESAAQQTGDIQAFTGDTQIFITPGYEFKVVDALLTNFHLPESTLLMLVSAFAGYEHIMNAYRHAVAQQYRFFSYGDAMFIQRLKKAH